MTTILKDEGKRRLPFDQPRIIRFIQSAFKRFPELDVDSFITNISRYIGSKEEIAATSITNKMLMTALENVAVETPTFDGVAAEFKLRDLYKQASVNRGYDPELKYGSFYSLIKMLTNMGIYTPDLLARYSKDEIYSFEDMIDPDKDKLLTYASVLSLSSRYTASGYDGSVYELPQERFMVIAMHIHINEPVEKRAAYVAESYWALSNLYMTVATPTLANAGKSFGQLSSCFIDTVDDSLRGIYDSNTDVATLSKSGGGIGVYMGKVRALKSDIKGFKGKSSGIIPWIKQLNNTAVSVDQLGTRSGAIAVYLDVWHKDIMGFLDLKLNNGDERKRAHDIFTGVCLPDLFMEQVDKRGEWYLFDPHEVKTVMGYSLEECFDERKGSGTFRSRYWDCVNHPDLSKVRVNAIDVMKRMLKSELETGTPYHFYRDAVNRANPNKHAGMIYCSNLCTEITQNQSATVILTETEEDGIITTRKKAGDFVVCNLSSINLARAVIDDVLERLITIQVRMLDNIIEINDSKIEVLQAVATNRKYRAIGLGTFGWDHLRVLKGLKWESDEAVQYCDELYEEIAFLTIKASMELSCEKGWYPKFEGSEWDTGEYFDRRGYDSERWKTLRFYVHHNGIRNGHLMAVAPNMSTAAIAGSTASIDPIFSKAYAEEKNGMKTVTIVPDLNDDTTWLYKSAWNIDQHWSIKQNAKRQRHIDQAISFNLYVLPTIKAKDLLELHMAAWKSDLKTTYYTRSQSQKELEACESCSS
ncbi:ribonucleoside-diphosphate reductase subunit alpha [Paenibacillus sp. OV219]|uniref:ribonucleoside-diphosphate reductase subunit alpha n=1 Tax=Paenibacillus sp. OV219 TaxID=1884377 RepID=UPI0008AFD42F|nr:ribonucleoside-diphosphate reductase subunit alpha [Paenibacillus sp. OV219]SEN20623.1 ribonucleoside-diphosphate reductase alpha chain [Paenibacillus sp. OV219]